MVVLIIYTSIILTSSEYSGDKVAVSRRNGMRLRTTNLVERLNEEIRRRTRVARLFPNEASCLRLVSAILMEIVVCPVLLAPYCY
jgi:hypothetical protein